jgi:hypothetical protein
MKTLFAFLILTLVFTYFSCENNNKDTEYTFEAEVQGRNFDCGLFAIKFYNDLEKVKQIAGPSIPDNIYIAKNLPEDLQTSGLTIILNIRKPMDTEVGICTARGPSYPWIVVTNARLK